MHNDKKMIIEETPEVMDLIERALQEDVGTGDVTTLALVPKNAHGTAAIITREPCCVAGAGVAAAVFKKLDPELTVNIRIQDAEKAPANSVILAITGALRSILTAERVALNFMQRLCGIATLTAAFVKRANKIDILDTRKTTPTLRILEKYAVKCGGGVNHRMGLFDMILIKDNHRRIRQTQGGTGEAIREARRHFPNVPIELEVENEDELRAALEAKPDWILLDNMTPDQMRRCVAINAGQCRLEASGGITLSTVADVAATGVNAASLGCLTHSAPSVDLTLELM